MIVSDGLGSKRPVSPTYSSDPFLAILSADSGQIGVRLN
jgi:hypothetical protein